MAIPFSEKLRKEAGRLMAAVDHSEFWRDSGFEPRTESHRESELKQISDSIMASKMLAEALEKDREQIEHYTAEQKDNIRIIQKEHEKAVRREKTRKHSSDIEEKIHGEKGVKKKWLKAQKENDFDLVKEQFEELVQLFRKYADAVREVEDRDCERYEILFEKYEPHIELETVEKKFKKLEGEIKNLVKGIEASEQQSSFENLSEVVEDVDGLHKEIVFGLLEGNEEKILVKEGPYGMERGDVLGSGMNVNSDQPWPKAIGTTVHEFGHVDYRTYLPEKFVFTPLAEPASDTIDEACARLWQTHVGQQKYFWEQLSKITEKYGLEFDPEIVHREVNRVKPENQQRINADDLTYHLHVIALFRIERKLINGEIEVEELEETWDEEMSRVLPNYSREVSVSEKFLQDPHWGKGKFGYYPTYSLGQLAATQIYKAAENHVDDLETKLRQGDYSVLSEWLADNLYHHGRRYPTQELIRRATGEKLSCDPFLEYAREKFKD